MQWAIFCCPKNKNRSVDPPCLDPLSYGRGNEPDQHLLLRRGRVTLFNTEEEAIEALQKTCDQTPKDDAWKAAFKWQFIECEFAEEAVNP